MTFVPIDHLPLTAQGRGVAMLIASRSTAVAQQTVRRLPYFLAQRRGEIGIRIALGASRNHVVASTLCSACLMLVTGLFAGTLLALLFARPIGAFIFGLKPWDPLTLVAAAAILSIVTVAASLAPAVRASKVNPVEALRTE